MVRHSNEGKRFSVKPSKDEIAVAEKMRKAGIQDLSSEDLTGLLETRRRIEEERQAIEKTIQEIRNRVK
jgi:hypothetical protein